MYDVIESFECNADKIKPTTPEQFVEVSEMVDLWVLENDVSISSEARMNLIIDIFQKIL